MANQALAVLESALRTRKLDRTLTTALPPLDRFDAASLVPSDVEALDTCLGGGLPRGQLSELAAGAQPGLPAGVRTAGRTTLLLQMMAAAAGRGELVALIDTGDCFDVASAMAAGIDLDRLLWIRGTALASSPITVERIVDRALKSLNLVLQAGGFGLVAIDLADVPLPLLKRLPFTTWLRLQRTVEGSDTACVLLVPDALARSAGGLTLSLTGRSTWAGTADRSRRLAGLAVHASVISPRRRVEGDVTVAAVATDSY
jgi:recombination protein RecA